MEAFSKQLLHHHNPISMDSHHDQLLSDMSKLSSSSSLPHYCSYFSGAKNPEHPTNVHGATMAHESSSSPDTHKATAADRTRKSQPKDASKSKSRKQKRINGGFLKEGEEKACGEPPAGYIHVRARRGQATDSHSLAERVRRERISERMRMLQSLVPGCDKVTGKALMLDEIINYVQSLQNQVEFLSMKLASMNPLFYEFGVDIESYVHWPELLKMGAIPQDLVQCLGQAYQITHHTTLDEAATTMDYQLMDTTSTLSLPHGHDPTAFPQDGSSRVMQVGVPGQGPLNQVEFNSMCL